MENEPGALSRVIGLFSQRGYNIDSFNVANTDDPTLSRLTICTSGDEKTLEQITKQCHKLVDVLTVKNITEQEHVERELVMIKVVANDPASKDSVKRIADIFRAQIVDVHSHCYTVQLAGPPARIKALTRALQDETSIIEMVRSGAVGMLRGKKALLAKQL
jgi:acetolactate synthase-1/3 small subunit